MGTHVDTFYVLKVYTQILLSANDQLTYKTSNETLSLLRVYCKHFF